MVYNRQSANVPSTWGQLNASAVELLFAVALLIGSASLVSMASGDPETMALVALTGITVVLLGLSLVRLSEYLRRTDLSSF
ncbi:hypothetical protein OB920_06135 [Halobacteria archaeon HArc-gm2]|nr:hypothetical protein [Halobacteria archaeon HArc-gm2]